MPADETLDPRESRKRWLWLLPALFVTYSLAYLDRANYGLGAAAGLAATLHITASDSALLGSLFFLGYFLFQIPGMAYARRHSSARIVFVALILWGTLAALTGVIRQFRLLALDRFLLGIAESIVFPAMIVLIAQWFTRAERSRANSALMLANPVTVLWMSVVTGYLIQAFGWQRAFIFEGLPAVLWAFLWLLFVRDKPSQARWIGAQSAAAIERQLAAEQLALAPVGGLREALFRRDVLALAIAYFCWSLGVYGFVLWLPTIIRAGASTGIGRTGLLAAAPYLLAIVLMLAASHLSDRTQRRRAIVWPFLILAGLALFASFLFAKQNFWIAYAALILAGGGMYAPYGAFFAFVSETIPKTVFDEVLAFINSAGALGGFAGSWLVGLLQARTGNSEDGFLLMSGSLIGAGLLMLFFPRQTNPIPMAPRSSPPSA